MERPKGYVYDRFCDGGSIVPKGVGLAHKNSEVLAFHAKQGEDEAGRQIRNVD
jgi:hypothetical protein